MMSKVEIEAQKFKRIYTKFTFLPLLYLFIFVGSTCVTQDDYATLSELTSHGFFGPSNAVWTGLGGNISSVLPRTLALKLNIFPDLPVGLVVYSSLTLLLILSAFNHLLSRLMPRYIDFSLGHRLGFLAFLALGFEGIFTPGEVGVFGFSAAAGVHIWPICLLVLADKFLQRDGFLPWGQAFLAISYASNANVPEGLLTLFCLTALTLKFALKDKFWRRKPKTLPYLVICISAVACFTTIFLASGFEARTKSIGVSLDLKSTFFSVVRALLFFGADIVSHPFIYLAFISGMYLNKRSKMEVSMRFLFEISVVLVIYFLLLAVGSGIAYPAWHQSLGLYVILLPLAFVYGVTMSNHLSFNFSEMKIIAISIIVFCIALTFRSGYLAIDRKLSWDSHFQKNVCVALGRTSGQFVGSEITYPPKNLGVEDLNTWPWMADGFKTWIKGSKFNCSSPTANK